MTGVAVISAIPTVRAGLRALLQEEPDLSILATGPDAELLDPAAPPNVLLVDLPATAAPLLDRLSARFPDAAQVWLLDAPDAYRPREGAGARPWAALLRDAAPEEILAAVRAVAVGLVVLDPAIARLQATATPALRTAEPLNEPLTEREREVLQLLALGLPNKSIAARLGVSEHTAKFHVGSILAKLGAASRTEAVALAARQGVLVL